jgi:hypothetical protein
MRRRAFRSNLFLFFGIQTPPKPEKIKKGFPLQSLTQGIDNKKDSFEKIKSVPILSICSF